MEKKFYMVSLGCAKNLVDSEQMLARLSANGYTLCEDPDEADIGIINTCAFIQPAQEEAIMNILAMEKLKDSGRIEKIIVTGCFPERNYNSFKENFPKIDAYLKLSENDTICQTIEKLYGLEPSKPIKKYERVLTNSLSYAYL